MGAPVSPVTPCATIQASLFSCHREWADCWKRAECSMDYICREFVEHFHAERPHQGLDNGLLVPHRRQKERQADLIPLGMFLIANGLADS
jgi:hypothetical protein